MSLCHLLHRLCATTTTIRSPISISVLHQSIHNFSTNVLVSPRLNLHKRVQSLIRASDLARQSVFSNTRFTVLTCETYTASDGSYVDLKEKKITKTYQQNLSEKLSQMDNTTDLSNDACQTADQDEIFLQRKMEQQKHMVAQQQEQKMMSLDGSGLSAAKPTETTESTEPTESIECSYDFMGDGGGGGGGGDGGGGDGGGGGD